MANTNAKTRTESTYEFELEQADIVGMMNDPQVLLEGGNVAEDQAFQIILKKANGSEIVLKDMGPDDILVFRYMKVTTDENPTALGPIDVTGA